MGVSAEIATSGAELAGDTAAECELLPGDTGRCLDGLQAVGEHPVSDPKTGEICSGRNKGSPSRGCFSESHSWSSRSSCPPRPGVHFRRASASRALPWAAGGGLLGALRSTRMAQQSLKQQVTAASARGVRCPPIEHLPSQLLRQRHSDDPVSLEAADHELVADPQGRGAGAHRRSAILVERARSE